MDAETPKQKSIEQVYLSKLSISFCRRFSLLTNKNSKENFARELSAR